MSTSNDKWTRVHDLALVYITLAHGTDHELSDPELHTITRTLQEWREDFSQEAVQEVVMEAMTVYLEQDAATEVARAMERLKATLTEEERRRALEGIVRIAEADGVLLSNERSLISTLATIWGVKQTSRRLLEASTVIVEEQPAWSLLHDISLIYLVLAHSTDNELSEPEIAAMVERLGDWQPAFKEEEVRAVVRDALRVYARQPDREALGASIDAIQQALPLIQRLALLDDLVYIAEVDGGINDHEKEMITTLARAWHVGVRLNGQADGTAA